MHMTRRILLILGICLLLQPLAVSAQIATDTPAIGVWMGAIKMGGTHPRLVFHIAADNTRRLTGTVGSPDKGVKGIPLSRVYVSGASIVIEVSAAGASFKGDMSSDQRTINGTWKEGEASYLLILERVTSIPEYRRSDSDNASSLEFQLASQYFDFYSDRGDREVLGDLEVTLGAAYSRITKHMQTKFTEKIRVYIYPTLGSFHNAIFLPDAPGWVVGAAGRNELKIVSPRNPGAAHTYNSLMQAVVHELTHTVVLNVREQGHVGLPKWLNEGYAFYEASQMTENMRKAVKGNLAKGSLPSWNQLDQAGTVEFGDMDGYAYSSTIVEFLIHSYGRDKLRQLILAPEKMREIYGASNEELEKMWTKYLRNLKG